MKIAKTLLEGIITLTRECYPQECCGFLIGKRRPHFQAARVAPVPNANRERSIDRYEIDPKDFLKMEKNLAPGEEIIGTYHSHPEHEPFPSPHDSERAFPAYVYLIVGLYSDSGKVKNRAWTWQENPTPHWEEEAVETE
jgi:proteasome lid subunit RPN8/RPN11